MENGKPVEEKRAPVIGDALVTIAQKQNEVMVLTGTVVQTLEKEIMELKDRIDKLEEKE